MHASLIKSFCCLYSARHCFESNSCALHSCLNNLHSYLLAVFTNEQTHCTSLHIWNIVLSIWQPTSVLLCCTTRNHKRQFNVLLMSAIVPQVLPLLLSSATYLDACPIVHFYFLLCSRLFKAVSFCKAACTLHKAYQSGEGVLLG